MFSRLNLTTPLRLAAAGLMLALLQGCATGPNANPADPLEPFNRTVFNFNDGVDRVVLKPVATVYRDALPSQVRTGVTNFFGNISDVWSLVNNVLQLKPKEAVETLARVGVNTIIGLGGVLDVATDLNLPKHKQDFGLTLGYWGVGSGAYIVLPLLGPSSVRDTLGTVVDFKGDLVSSSNNVPVRNTLGTLRIVNRRSELLGPAEVLEQAALDKYSFTRDVYLQRRRSQTNGGKPEVEERYDLPEDATAPQAVVPPAPPAEK